MLFGGRSSHVYWNSYFACWRCISVISCQFGKWFWLLNLTRTRPACSQLSTFVTTTLHDASVVHIFKFKVFRLSILPWYLFGALLWPYFSFNFFILIGIIFNRSIKFSNLLIEVLCRDRVSSVAIINNLLSLSKGIECLRVVLNVLVTPTLHHITVDHMSL